MKRSGMLAVVVAIGAVAAGCGSGGGKAHTRGAGAATVGTMVVAGGLVEARVGHTATLVEDGLSALIVGGETLTAKATRSAELWRAGQCTPLPSGLLTPRAGHRAVPLESGDVWIVGGRDAQGRRLDTTEVWSPATGEFTAGPELKAPRLEPAIGYHDGGVVIAFGAGEDSVELWSWDLRPVRTIEFEDRQGRRGDGVVSFEGDSLYLSGGTGDDGRPAAPIWLDLVTGLRRPAPGAEQVQGGLVLTGTLDGGSLEGLVVGGARHGEPFKRVQRVRTDDQDVTLIPAVTVATPRERAAAVALPIGVVLAGGMTRHGATTAVEVLDASGTTPAPSLNVARADLQATLLLDGSVLFTGGRGADELPVALVELLVAPGGDAPDAAGLFAGARAEQAAWEALVAERDAAQAEVARLQGALATATGDLAAERAEVTRLQGALAAAQQTARDLEARIAALEAQVTTSRAEEQRRRDQLSAARKDAAAAQGDVAGLQAQVSQAEGRAGDLQRTRDALRAELAGLTTQVGTLEQQLANPTPRSGMSVGGVVRLPGHPMVTKTGSGG